MLTKFAKLLIEDPIIITKLTNHLLTRRSSHQPADSSSNDRVKPDMTR